MSEADRRLSEESEQRFLDLYAHLLGTTEVETGRLNAYASSPLCSVVQSWSIGLLMIWKTSFAR